MWKPTEPWNGGAGVPSIEYSYFVDPATASSVTTKVLQTLSPVNYLTSVSIVDGLGRSREEHSTSPAGGQRIVAATWYDSAGRVARQSQPTAVGGTPGAGLATNYGSSLGAEQRLTYDSLGRVTSDQTFAGGVYQFQTLTGYNGGRSVTTPPVGGQTASHTDNFGRTDKVEEIDRLCCSTDTSVVIRPNGEKVIFGVSHDGSIQYRSMLPGQSWGEWLSLGNTDTIPFTAVSATVFPDGRIGVVTAKGNPGWVDYREETSPGNWSGWTGLGCCYTDVSVTVNAQNEPWIFARGTDGYVWDNSRNGGWSGWLRSVGGSNNIYGLAATRHIDGRVSMAVSTSDIHVVWVNKQLCRSCGFSGFQPALTEWAGDIDLEATAEGGLYLSTVSVNGVLWEAWETPGSGWSGWSQIGSSGQTKVATARTTDNRFWSVTNDGTARLSETTRGIPGLLPSCCLVDNASVIRANGDRAIFGITPGGALIYKTHTAATGAWSSWIDLGNNDPATASNVKVAAVVRDDQTIAVATLKSNGNIIYRHEFSPGGSWQWWQWVSSGCCAVQDVTLANRPGGGLVAFVVHTDNRVYEAHTSGPGGGAWSGWVSAGTGANIQAVSATNYPDGRATVAVLTNDIHAVWVAKESCAGCGLGGFSNATGGSVDDISLSMHNSNVLYVAATNGDSLYNAWENSPGSWDPGPWGSGWHPLYGSGHARISTVRTSAFQLVSYTNDTVGSLWVLDQAYPGGPFGGAYQFWVPGGGSVDVTPMQTTKTTSYGYSVRDELVSITDMDGVPTSATFDWMGRRLSLSDPDQGPSSMVYDAAGNVVSSTDPRGVVVMSTFDGLGRRRSQSVGGVLVAEW